MELTVQELAVLVGGQFAEEGAAAKKITGAAAIGDAGEGQVTFFGNVRYLSQLKTCRATAALVPMDFRERISAIAMRVENPSIAFACVVAKFAPVPLRFEPGVHPSAVIGRDVTLGEGVSIQAFVVVEDGAEIGAGSVIGSHSYIGHGVKIGSASHFAPRVTVGARCIVGDRVIIHSGAVLGSDGFGFEFCDGRQVKIPQIGIVQIDDDVEIGANVAIDRARFGRTWVQEGTKIDNLVQIAHNVVIGRHCLVVSQTGIAGSTRLGDRVTMAGQSGVVGHVEIGEQAVIGGGSGVTKSVAAGEVMFGYPAAPMREAKEQIALIRRLPKLVERVKRLEENAKFAPRETNP